MLLPLRLLTLLMHYIKIWSEEGNGLLRRRCEGWIEDWSDASLPFSCCKSSASNAVEVLKNAFARKKVIFCIWIHVFVCSWRKWFKIWQWKRKTFEVFVFAYFCISRPIWVMPSSHVSSHLILESRLRAGLPESQYLIIPSLKGDS